MKKLFSSFFAFLIAAVLIMNVSAATVKDGKIVNSLGMGGIEIGEADQNGVNLQFMMNEGAQWSSRVGYIDPVKLDGLIIRLKNVKMDADDSCFAVMFNNGVGQWTDTPGLLFINYNAHQMRTKKKEKVEFGYTLAITDSSNNKGWIYTPNTSTLSGDVTIYLKKLDSKTWEYNCNGTKTQFPAQYLDEKVPNQSLAYINFGCWANTNDVSYSVCEITNGDMPPELKDLMAADTGNKTTVIDETGNVSQTDKSAYTSSDTTETVVVEDENSQNPSTDNGGITQSQKTILIIAIAFFALLVIGFTVFIILIIKNVKKRKKTERN